MSSSLIFASNGLSGPIGPDLFKLTSLESIDFNDNDLRGEVPPEIEKLSNLKRLRLSYNMLTSLPVTLANLTRLSFLHIHSNRISGNDTYISLAGSSDRSSCIQRGECKFIADCKIPGLVFSSLVCALPHGSHNFFKCYLRW